MRFPASLAGLCCLLLFISSCDSGEKIAPNGETLLLGVVAPMEGTGGFKGRQAMMGIEKVLQIFPHTEGGTRLRVHLEPARDETSAVIAALQKLAANPEVKAVISLAGSDAMLAAAPVLNQLQLPVLAASATNPEVVRAGPWLSQVIYDDSFQGAVAALFVRDELLVKRVAVVSNPNNRYSRFLADRFTEKFHSIGGVITDQIQLTGPARDYRHELEAARVNEPELIYLTVGTNKTIAIGEALHRLDWQPGLMGPDGSLSSLVEQVPEHIQRFEGMLGTDVYTSKVPLSRVGEDYRKISHRDLQSLDTYSVLGAESLAILVDVFERCGELAVSRACMARTIRQTEDFPGLLGHITITGEGRALRPLVVNALRKGNIVYQVRVY